MMSLVVLLFFGTASPDGALYAAQAPVPIEVEIKQGKLVGARTIRVRQGDEVTLRVASDKAIALHLHGYDIERAAAPDMPAVFSFTARATGRFSVEEHIPDAGEKSHSHAPAVLYLEVLPK